MHKQMNVGREECGGKEKEDDCPKRNTRREQIGILREARKTEGKGYTTYAIMTPTTCPSMMSPLTTVRLPVITTIGRSVAST